MTADVTGVALDEIDMTGAAALREAIASAGRQQMGLVDPELERAEHERIELTAPQNQRAPAPEHDGGPETVPTIDEDDDARWNREPSLEARSPHPALPISEPVEVGDLLVVDADHPGKLRRAATASDPGVVGIVAGESSEDPAVAVAPVASCGFVEVKADAGYGEIRPGDLLTSSFTPGHAMRAPEIVPGTIIGKALQSLETGTGRIRVLVMPR